MNPLLSPSTLKHQAVPFHQIKPEHFLPALEDSIKRGHENLSVIKKKPASFENTLKGLEECSEELEFIFTLFNNLLAANSSPELQQLSMQLGPKVASFANDILLDPEVFARVEEVYKNRSTLASAEERRLSEKVYRDFQRSGAGLTETQKERMRAIDERLAQLSPKFRENVLKATNAFELWIENEKDLSGLPQAYRDMAREAAIEKGRSDQWLFTLHQPSFVPFMKFAEKRELREKLFRAYNSRALGGEFDNQPVIRELTTLMTEKAKLMGCESYAAFALQLRMAEKPETVITFLNRLRKAAWGPAEKEVAEVQALATTHGGPDKIQSWDFAFYSEKLKEQKYSFDEESLRPYFKLENVLAGVFEHASRLFNLKFTQNDEYPVYHPDVKVFEVQKANGDFIGLFYADFHPRATKSQGAWMTNYYEQGLFRGDHRRPHVSIVCNFSKPTADQPSLLNFDEVSTLFHEFGHALHSLLSQVKYRSLAGTNVYLDFVELPSQIFENWAEEPESLKLFAFHYRTNDLIPLDLIERLKRSQRFQAAYATMRQLSFAFLDMAWYQTPPPASESVQAFEDRVLAGFRLLPKVEGTNISAGFGHIFGGGYSSGYYSYKWAEALDADAFELFRERGIFDRDAAERFENFILSKGGSDHPMKLYEQFRGRAPDPEALLRRDGLV